MPTAGCEPWKASPAVGIKSQTSHAPAELGNLFCKRAGKAARWQCCKPATLTKRFPAKGEPKQQFGTVYSDSLLCSTERANDLRAYEFKRRGRQDDDSGSLGGVFGSQKAEGNLHRRGPAAIRFGLDQRTWPADSTRNA